MVHNVSLNRKQVVENWLMMIVLACIVRQDGTPLQIVQTALVDAFATNCSKEKQKAALIVAERTLLVLLLKSVALHFAMRASVLDSESLFFECFFVMGVKVNRCKASLPLFTAPLKIVTNFEQAMSRMFVYLCNFE